LIPDLTCVRYGRSPAGRIRIHLPNPVAHECPTAAPSDTAAAVAGLVIDQLASLHLALRSVIGVAEGLLWGNAAAALAIVTNTLLHRGEDHHHGVAEVSQALLERPPLAGRLGGDVIGSIKRRTCCLYYRTAARRTCGDCPLTGAAVLEIHP
jgi:ferric iron reductase protein FhuF